MVQQQVVGPAAVNQLAVVPRQRFEPVVGGLDEDFRFVAGAPQHSLNAEHLVSNRVAIPERRQHLMDADHARFRPFGSPATTSLAAGSS